MSEALKLSEAFSRLINEELTAEQITEVNKINRIPGNESICGTHDYIDANEVVAAAFKEVFGYDFPLPGDVEDGLFAKTTYARDCEIWNLAWSISKRLRFQNHLLTCFEITFKHISGREITARYGTESQAMTRKHLIESRGDTCSAVVEIQIPRDSLGKKAE